MINCFIVGGWIDIFFIINYRSVACLNMIF